MNTLFYHVWHAIFLVNIYITIKGYICSKWLNGLTFHIGPTELCVCMYLSQRLLVTDLGLGQKSRDSTQNLDWVRFRHLVPEINIIMHLRIVFI